ncbi:hypothetical protein KQH90_03580 [Anaerosalibacter bizertensis]|uniref:hypothetical protein n=1 Tax=Anaerosalibacter bizertensis TaxID=932217 RepID=UPI001C0F0663|nr:hypothetical protein [Anaerosalibacter bizertensis]MBU5293117.1 hypothetical protein [Anaerosalibacter bizertensis]
MDLNTVKDLEAIIDKAIATKQPLGLLIEMPGFKEPEMIINPAVNLEKKLDYYKKVYDENLEHKHAKGIKIIGYTFM